MNTLIGKENNSATKEERVEFYYEATPNPQTLKFVCSRQLTDESLSVTSAKDASRSPLAQKLFGFPWMSSLLIGTHFVAITKMDWVSWTTLADPLRDLLEEHVNTGQQILQPVKTPSQTNEPNSLDPSGLVQQIINLLDLEIRPAVAMDGGDIVFDRFEDGVVYLHMQGACSGCPSSTMTLKQGIETRLTAAFPQVREVVAI